MAKKTIDLPAYIEGYDNSFVWVRIPEAFPNKILTLPRATLKRGMATARRVLARVNPDSFTFGDSGYTAEVEFLNVIGDTKGSKGAVETGEGASSS